MALRCVVYMRKSSKDSDESTGKNKQKYSLERQEKDLRNYFEAQKKVNEGYSERSLIWKGEEGVDLFREDGSAKVPARGYAGKKANREAFLNMIEQIKKGKFDVLICTDLSRLSRNAEDTGTIVQLLDPYQSNPQKSYLEEIRTVDKVFTNSATDKFTLSLFMSVAKFENDQRGKNTASGMNRKRSAGGTTGKAPVGYLNVGTEKGEKSVEAHSENFEKMRELWEMLISGQYSLKEIYNRKKELGIVHTYGGRERVISDSQVRECFRNKYYQGLLKSIDPSDQEELWLEGNHPTMVSEEEFNQAQMVLQRLGFKHAKYEKAVGLGELLAGFAVSGEFEFITKEGETRPARLLFESKNRFTCSSCQHRWQTKNDTSKCPQCSEEINETTKCSLIERFTPLANKLENGKPVWGKNRKASPSVTLKAVAKNLEKELSKIVITDGLFEVFRRQLYTLWLEQEKIYKASLDRLKKKIQKLEEEQSNLKRVQFLPELSELKRKEAEETIVRVEEDIYTTQGEIESLKEEHEESFEQAWQKLQVMRDAKSIMADAEFEPKKALLLSLGSNLKVWKDRVEMEWLKPFDILAQSDISHIPGNPKKGINYHLKEFGSRDWTRTSDQLVNSQLLYH